MSSEVSGRANILARPTIDTIIEATAKHFNVTVGGVVKCARKTNNPARKAAMILCREVGMPSLNDIATAMGGITYSTVSSTMGRAKQEPKLIGHIDKIRKRLMPKRKQNQNPVA